MVEDDRRLAAALAIQKRFGPDGPRWIAGRIGALALAGYAPGVERLRAIAQAYEGLLTATRQ